MLPLCINPLICDDFVSGDIDSTELEDFLAEIMSAEFNSVVDDNSLAEVSQILKLKHPYCSQITERFISQGCYSSRQAASRLGHARSAPT